VAANQPSVAPRETPLRRLRWALWILVALLGLTAVVVYLVSRPAHPATPTVAPASTLPAATWAAGARRAPTFTLRDERGAPLALEAFRGRPVVIAFIDPVCRDYCPTEAKHLNDVVASFPAAAKPAVVAVSVNAFENRPSVLRLDRRKWSLGPHWHWAVGSGAALAKVWKAYHIAVLASTQTIAGVKVHRIAHTEAAYVVDAAGDQRALFVWPYAAEGVVSVLRGLRAP
jgi:cytochrome oxidase Cu insertion factor (SCO1/SenC/PrrC family)